MITLKPLEIAKWLEIRIQTRIETDKNNSYGNKSRLIHIFSLFYQIEQQQKFKLN